jgi:hypothetical protein
MRHGVLTFFTAGEKRKRKLQYLQQLIKDDSNDEQTPYTSPQQHEACSTDHNTAPSSSPFMPASSNHYMTLSTSSTELIGSLSSTSTPTYDIGLLPATQTPSLFEPRWSSPTYETPSPSSMGYLPAWMSSIGYSPQIAHHLSPSVSQEVFAQAASPYHHPRDLLPNSDHYVLGLQYEHYSVSQDQTTGTLSVSLPHSPPPPPLSSFHGHYHYPGPH